MRFRLKIGPSGKNNDITVKFRDGSVLWKLQPKKRNPS